MLLRGNCATKPCDFLIKQGLKIAQAIQVTKTLADSDVKHREYQGLLEAMRTHHLDAGLILTLDEECQDEIQEDGRTMRIEVLPAWKWFLSDVELA